jgi:multidrug efflux pump subunit AcrA (membrane-fusion protein)/YHS domain-containing protein
MKKLFYGFLILVLLLASYLLGSWQNQKRAEKKEAFVGKGQQVELNNQPAEQASDDAPSMSPGSVKITPEKQQLIGVQIGPVEMKSETYTVRTVGRVAADENRTYRVLASTEGWVSDVQESTTGSLVKKDQLMAKVYNYQFLARQQQYLYALETEERRRARMQASKPQSPESKSRVGQQPKEQEESLQQESISMIPATPGGEADMTGKAVYTVRDLLEVAKLELYTLGVGDHQIREITRTKRLTSDIEIRSPVTGIVLSRNVSPQQRFEKGVELFRIGDLTQVWIVADVFNREAQYLRPGMSARVVLPDQDKVFKAKVTDVPPVFDPTTRVLKMRLEADNAEYVLRPDMFVDVEFLITLPPALTVPVDAVLDSGLKKTVFVERGNGFFEPREVETGWRFGNRMEITKGLKRGERIALSGTFLIDSESRLELAASGMAGTMSKDPVCGAEVSMNKADKDGRKSSYREKTYYFTSRECKEQFDKNPDRYAAGHAGESSPKGETSSRRPPKTEGKNQ